MTTMAKRKRSRKPKAEMQADDESRILREMAETKRGYEIPASLRREQQLRCCLCGRAPCECYQGRGKDPIDDLCGEAFSAVAVYAMSAAIAFAGGLGIGWWVWA